MTNNGLMLEWTNDDLMKKINIQPITKREITAIPDGKTVYAVTSSTCTRDYQEDKEWGSWERTYNCKVLYITKNKPDSYRNVTALEVSQEVYNADKVYLVCVTYGTGDTFGHSTGNLDVYKVFADKEAAKELATRIIAEGNDFSYPKGEYAPTWTGYFENVDDVEVFETEYE